MSSTGLSFFRIPETLNPPGISDKIQFQINTRPGTGAGSGRSCRDNRENEEQSMLTMILKMTGVTVLYVLLTLGIRKWTDGKQMGWWKRLLIGLIFGGCSVLSTHVAIDYSQMLLNVRDLGPLIAGLFFDPFSGILAGLIGGIERYIAGTYWNIGSYTRIACSVSTCLAGFLAAVLRVWLFRRKKPSATFGFILGAVMEVFHMYVVLITHRADMTMAMYVVKVCSGPMIVFTGLGLAAVSVFLRMTAGEWQNPFCIRRREEVPVSHRFQFWLFIVTVSLLVSTLVFIYMIQTESAIQDGRNLNTSAVEDIRESYEADPEQMLEGRVQFHVGRHGSCDLIEDHRRILAGKHEKYFWTARDWKQVWESPEEMFFTSEKLFGSDKTLCYISRLDERITALVQLPASEMYADRDAQVLEIAFADILLFAAIYTLISQLVQLIVVDNLNRVNASLTKITGGDLDEVADVRNSLEFASLSDDINQTVHALKGYITAAEKRIEEELEFARTIQDSALPKNFSFPRDDFGIYAIMDPAREVGGDFYDFFLVDQDRIALVIADVSGKGIPAALFMMRAKTGIRDLVESGRDPADVLARANSMLCEGNEAEMFVTVWIGIVDMQTGRVKCANAGHEYPALKRAGGAYELIKDRHGLALAAMDGMTYKEYELQLNPGDRLFVYTDGVPEAINSSTEQYGTDRMIRALNASGSGTLQDALSAVQEDLAAFVGEEDQFDDITMLNFSYRESGKAVIGMDTLTVEAKTENLDQVLAFIGEKLEAADCSIKAQTQICVAAEEIYVNIASYAYAPETGNAVIRMTVADGTAEIEFRDRGTAFDPLAKADPDVTLAAEERPIGGLGIFMVKKSMDEVLYRREDGENILTIRKKLQ